jgi:hypothetical protein
MKNVGFELSENKDKIRTQCSVTVWSIAPMYYLGLDPQQNFDFVVGFSQKPSLNSKKIIYTLITSNKKPQQNPILLWFFCYNI